MIGILDYGMGNVGSIYNMLNKIGLSEVVILSDPTKLTTVKGIILPGVGSFDTGMYLLKSKGFIEYLNYYANELKKPILGICLGMQLLGNQSEEGTEHIQGLGYIDFDVKKLDVSLYGLKVPHMGWDYVDIVKSSFLTNGLKGEQRYYFVHSYYAECRDKKDILMTCQYGISITAAVQHENIIGVQFHPEKSHRYGMAILKKFIEVCL